MTSPRLRALACALPLVLVACSKLEQRAGHADMAADRTMVSQSAPASAGVPAAEPEKAPAAAPERRYIALRHDVQVMTDAGAVETAWRAANEACAAADCEVLSSALIRDDERRPSQATLDVRVPPEKFDAFLHKVTALGSVGRHLKTAEDKTGEVIDVEARIRNQTEFRDNLRRLLATPGAKLKDLIEVQRELVQVQSELDSLASRRKVLAAQTDKVHVILSFSARPSVLEQGMWSPVSSAVVGAGHLFARSLGGVIEFVVFTLPWLALLVPLVVVFRRWRKRRAAQA